MKRVLIMTATIRPPINAAGVSRLDPMLRLEDYKEALKFYTDFLGNDLDQIIFAENTLSDLAPLKDVIRKAGIVDRVNFLSFDGNSFPPKFGRCYGEAKILDHVMSSDAVISSPGSVEYWKVTGRYKILNLKKMIASRPKDTDLYIDLRSHAKPPWADLRVLSWSLRGYETVLRNIAPEIREDLDGYRAGEHVAFEQISERLHKADIRGVTVWTTEPLIDGRRAYDGRNWSHGRQRAVYVIRSLQRRFLKRIIV